ncbi:hypothetical protein PTKU46_94510 [Paraburkholderia terrae]|uniref:hypothetical protein n=1 Tax=Paraburkholderia terrae TaxID=311230 RepID=UPI0030DECBDD
MFRPLFLLCTLFLLAAVPNAYSQQQPNPSKVTAVTQGGVGFVNISQGTAGISATIGQWGIPYPGGVNGPPLPGAEPSGPSILTVDIDVNDGGLVNFSYGLKTWDGGIYDWLDVKLITPSGTIPLVSNLGQPSGNNWGSFWQSPNISFSKDLSAWKNQHVQLVFSVEQDGYGDETQAQVVNLAIRSCAVAPLTTPPFTDSKAQAFENGQTLDTVDLSPAMQASWSCFAGLVGANRISSAYRPSEYQSHLREIWDKWNAPGNLKANTDPECATIKDAVQTEFNRHGLGASNIRPASGNGNHTRGLAIDVSINGLQNVDALAAQCQLYRPFPTTDRVHFQHQ